MTIALPFQCKTSGVRFNYYPTGSGRHVAPPAPVVPSAYVQPAKIYCIGGGGRFTSPAPVPTFYGIDVECNSIVQRVRLKMLIAVLHLMSFHLWRHVTSCPLTVGTL